MEVTQHYNNMKDFKTRATNDKRVYRDNKLKNNGLSQLHLHNQLNRDFQPSDEESMDYTKDATNRQQALALLNKLKAREMTGSCIAWLDGQPSLIETTRNSSKNVDEWTNNGKRIMLHGQAASDTQVRVASEWEAKLNRKRRSGFTLDETPTMAFKASGHLPAHYYTDETALEAYVESLTKES